MKVKKCKHEKSISVKDSKGKSLGKLCIVCEQFHKPSIHLTKHRNDFYEKEKEKKAKDPKFTPKKDEFCDKCKSKRRKVRKKQERIKVDFDKPQNTWQVNKQNPRISYKCLNCGHPWSHGLPMPIKPKYIVAPKQNKETLTLILQHAIKKELQIPKTLSKMVLEVEKELREKQEAKKEREKQLAKIKKVA